MWVTVSGSWKPKPNGIQLMAASMFTINIIQRHYFNVEPPMMNMGKRCNGYGEPGNSMGGWKHLPIFFMGEYRQTYLVKIYCKKHLSI
jgi:hypothetical protein